MARRNGAGKEYTLTDGAEFRAGLSRLLEEKTLCDVELVAEGKIFPAHKVVLAAQCSYFEAMFTRGFKESKSNSITLEEVSSTGLEILMDAIYKGRVHLKEACLLDTVAAAHHVQHTPLLTVCEEYLMETLKPQNCMARRTLASTYNMQDIVKSIDAYVLTEFKSFSHTESFLQLPLDDLCRYLERDDLVAKEVDIFEAMKCYVESNEAVMQSEENMNKLARLLRFGLIENDRLQEVAEVFPSLKDKIDDEMFNCQQIKSNGDEGAFLRLSRRSEEAKSRPRGNTTYMMHLRKKSDPESFKNNGAGDKIAFLREVEVKGRKDLVGWCENPPIAYLDRSVHTFVYNGNVFVFGGDSQRFNPEFHCYESRIQKWIKLGFAPTHYPFVCAYAFLVGTQFVVGGGRKLSSSHIELKDNLREMMCGMWVFNLTTGEWKYRESGISLSPVVVDAASCAFQNEGYVIGGRVPHDGNGALYHPDRVDGVYHCPEVSAYDPQTEKFVPKAPLNVPRSNATAGVINADDDDASILVVVGGIVRDQDSKTPCEVYSPRTDQWTCVLNDRSLREGTLVPTPGGGFGILSGEQCPMQYYETDKEGKLRTYKKLVEPAVSWFPGKDHWSYIEGNIMSLSVLTMLPKENPSELFKPKQTSIVMIKRPT